MLPATLLSKRPGPSAGAGHYYEQPVPKHPLNFTCRKRDADLQMDSSFEGSQILQGISPKVCDGRVPPLD